MSDFEVDRVWRLWELGRGPIEKILSEARSDDSFDKVRRRLKILWCEHALIFIDSRRDESKSLDEKAIVFGMFAAYDDAYKEFYPSDLDVLILKGMENQMQFDQITKDLN